MLHKGIVMYNTSQINKVPVSEASKTDPRVSKLMDDLSAGNASMCAPFPGMFKPMSETDKRMLENAISSVKQPR